MLHARQFLPPAEDSTLAGHKSQRPSDVVSSGRSFSHCVWLHQEPDHSYPVSELKEKDTNKITEKTFLFCCFLVGEFCCSYKRSCYKIFQLTHRHLSTLLNSISHIVEFLHIYSSVFPLSSVLYHINTDGVIILLVTHRRKWCTIVLGHKYWR